MVLRVNLWNRIKEVKVPLKSRVVTIRFYENVITKFRSNEGWKKGINYKIGVNQAFPLPSTYFGIYIDKLEACLEEVGCVGTNLARIVILILHVNNIYSYGEVSH